PAAAPTPTSPPDHPREQHACHSRRPTSRSRALTPAKDTSHLGLRAPPTRGGDRRLRVDVDLRIDHQKHASHDAAAVGPGVRSTDLSITPRRLASRCGTRYHML